MNFSLGGVGRISLLDEVEKKEGTSQRVTLELGTFTNSSTDYF
jgi:hypothetical protein